MQIYRLPILLPLVLMGACENREAPKSGSNEPDAMIATHEATKMSKTSPAFMASQTFELGGLCNMETLNGNIWGISQQVVSVANSVSISGWGVNEKEKSAPKQIFLRLQDSGDRVYYAETKLITRSDLSKHFNEDYFKSSGYSVKIDLSNLAPETYRAMVVMNVSGKSILCASGRTLVVKGA